MNDMYNSLETKKNAMKKIMQEKAIRVGIWFISNLFAIALPIGSIWMIDNMKGLGQFNIQDYYAEILVVVITICLNLNIYLDSKVYNIGEGMNAYIKFILIAVSICASLAYGISMAISQEQLNVSFIFGCSIFLGIVAFILGIICELKKKVRE